MSSSFRYLAGGSTQYFLTPDSEKKISNERLSQEHRSVNQHEKKIGFFKIPQATPHSGIFKVNKY